MRSLLIWVFTAVLFAGLGGLVVWSFERARAQREAEPDQAKEGEGTGQPHGRISRDKAGNVVIQVDHATQVRVGLEVKSLSAASHQPEAIAYGVLQEDPSRSFTVRSPLPGTLVKTDAGRWARLGDMLAENTVVGAVEPRLGPVEQADLAARLAAGQAEAEGARASLAALRASYESKMALHTNGGGVSDRVLQEAEAKVKGEEARLKAALETVRILQSSLTTTTRPAAALPLVVKTAGKVVELLAQPGESVESGQILLRVARFDRLVARVSLPAGEALNPSVSTARIVVTGHEHLPLHGERIALAPTADPTTGGQTVWFAVPAENQPLQPGMVITAYLPLPGEPAKGVLIPCSAPVRFAGKAWVYIQTGPESFTRREVALDVPTLQGWFVAEGLSPQDSVVVHGAQNLLSEELLAQSGGGEEE